MAARVLGLRCAEVCARLSLERWQYRRACETGLLTLLPDRSILPQSVEAAEADLPAWKKELAKEYLLNATAGARHLGVSREKFAHAMRQASIPPETEEPWKYGQTVRCWRTKDIDALSPIILLMEAEKAVASVPVRAAAAQKAALTRARNQVLRQQAEKDLAPWLCLDGSDVQRRVVFAAAVRRARKQPTGLPTSIWNTDECDHVVGLLAYARIKDWAPLTQLAACYEGDLKLLVPLSAIAHLAAPAAPEAVLHHVYHFNGWVLRETLSALQADPPLWLRTAWAEAALHQEHICIQDKLEQERRQVQAEAAKVLRQARYTDESVADLLDLPVDLVHQLQPRAGHWKGEHLSRLQQERPAWTQSEKAARQEVARRQANERRRLRTRARRSADRPA